MDYELGSYLANAVEQNAYSLINRGITKDHHRHFCCLRVSEELSCGSQSASSSAPTPTKQTALHKFHLLQGGTHCLRSDQAPEELQPPICACTNSCRYGCRNAFVSNRTPTWTGRVYGPESSNNRSVALSDPVPAACCHCCCCFYVVLRADMRLASKQAMAPGATLDRSHSAVVAVCVPRSGANGFV